MSQNDNRGLVTRFASAQLQEFTEAFRVVIVNGPRQAGKTTLLHEHQRHRGGEYRTLDLPAVRRVAETDPATFAQPSETPLIIDEVQLGGDRLVRTIKQIVDSNRQPGQFILSGSTRFLTTPGISESLAGRAVFIDLWPLSMAERSAGQVPHLIQRALAEPRSLIGHHSRWTRDAYLEAICTGGYPEAIRLRSDRLRGSWYSSYVQTIISRDIDAFASIRDVRLLERLLGLIAARSAGLLVYSDLARELDVSIPTAQTYLAHLDTVFLTATVPAWSTNATSRLTKSPKVFLTDTGLLAQQLGATPVSLRRPGAPALGGLVESFVLTELLKSDAVAEDVRLSHFRDRDGREIDFICEGRDGRIVAIEVKASLSPRADADRHLRWLRGKLGDRFAAGIVFYLGEQGFSMGDDIYLLPISSLWNHGMVRT
ncbi:ATP-binding protein [Microlunatus parietis]|uniref:AAA+ ATPase domain-containing protein n=1 Tax=Microlunatus parietis TaxID=682979 RepID=A0A7Y9IAA9_9ACTN|nr:ATP-binding protein [Microlunatus parietis]NYE73042.1 hypothetical protein [Microlunatus parietis]